MSKMKMFSILAAILVLGAGTWTACKKSQPDQPGQASVEKIKYHCPMHPTYTSDKPGDCPICNMKLVPVESDKKLLYYRSPMNPKATSPTPMKDEMGMDYIPVYAGEGQGIEAPVSGQAAVNITPERQQLIGVKIEEVKFHPLTKVIRTSARVAYDPELYNAIEEYKQALQSKDKVKDSPWPDVQERAGALMRASALRLRQLGLSDSQITNLEKDYQNSTSLLLSEKGGSVWIYAQVYESEMGLVQPGQTMEITSAALPGKKFYGAVKGGDQILNAETRSLKVRAEVTNSNGLLKPEMYVDAKIHADLGSKLAIPQDAVINTGERTIVFVDKGNGKYEPREVRLGNEAENYVEVLSGVSKGEKVVIGANFLIDSESKLKAAVADMGGSKQGK